MPTAVKDKQRKRLKDGREALADDFFFEAHRPTVEELEENARPDGTIAKISGVAGKLNYVNRNKRFYSRAAFESAITKATPKLARGRLLGQLDHPGFFDDATLAESAIIYKKLSIEDDPADRDKPFVTYEGFVLDTPKGKQLVTLLKAGVDVGMSTRGFGKSKSGTVDGYEGEVTIIEEYELDGIDAVREPSNEFGRVAKHEHEEGEEDMSDLTLESLRKDHGDLVAQLEAAARKGYITEAERDRAVKQAKEEFVRTLKADPELLRNVGLVTMEERDVAIATAKKEGETTGRQAATEEFGRGDGIRTAIDRALTPVKENVTRLETENADLKKQLFEKTADERKLARLKTIKDISDKAEHASYRTILRTVLESLPEAAELISADGKETDVVKAKIKEATEVWTAMGKPKGMGKIHPIGAAQNDKEDKPEEKKEAVQRSVHGSLAGMD